MKNFHFWKFVTAILLCEGAGVIGSFFTIASITGWYATLNKPSFVPPNWVFGPTWTSLYFLMGVSLYLVWIKGLNKRNRRALTFFGSQLALNTLWSIVFFWRPLDIRSIGHNCFTLDLDSFGDS